MSKKWNRETELDLLINFYDLSIDEARERYNASYKTIAGKLEKIFDSTEPDHIVLLMEASVEVKRRKGISLDSTPKSRKEHRLLRKMTKINRKLEELRSEKNE